MKNTIDNFAKEMILKYKPGFSDVNRGLSALNLALDVTKNDFNNLLSRIKDEFTTAKPVESITPIAPFQQEEPSTKSNPIDLYEQAKKNRASGVTLNKRKSADKIADPEIILERYINNNIIQKNCK